MSNNERSIIKHKMNLTIEKKQEDPSSVNIPISESVSMDAGNPLDGPLNVLIVGGTATGKTTRGIIPIILEAGCNIVVVGIDHVENMIRPQLLKKEYNIISIDSEAAKNIDDTENDIFEQLSESSITLIAEIMSMNKNDQNHSYSFDPDYKKSYIIAILEYLVQTYSGVLNRKIVSDFLNSMNDLNNFKNFKDASGYHPIITDEIMRCIIMESSMDFEIFSKAPKNTDIQKVIDGVHNTITFINLASNDNKTASISVAIEQIYSQIVENPIKRDPTIFILDGGNITLVNLPDKINQAYKSNIGFVYTMQCSMQAENMFGKWENQSSYLHDIGIQIGYGEPRIGSSFLYNTYHRYLQNESMGEVGEISPEIFNEALKSKCIISIDDGEYCIMDYKNPAIGQYGKPYMM